MLDRVFFSVGNIILFRLPDSTTYCSNLLGPYTIITWLPKKHACLATNDLNQNQNNIVNMYGLFEMQAVPLAS